jgi:uncharacterized membrane protein required for colicin V production
VTFYDWAVIAIIVGFVVRGWSRGFARQAIDIGLLVIGSLVVFRVSPVIGTIIAGMANVPYEIGRVVAGGLVFAILVVGSIVLGSFIATALHVVPGAAALNKLGGAAIGALFAVVVIVLGTTVASASPMPDPIRSGFGAAVSESPAGSTITDARGPVQAIVSAASGERLFGAIIAVREAVGDRLMAGTLPIPLPSVGEAPLLPSQVDAQELFDRINRERVIAGTDPLAWSPDLAIIAVSRATNVYRSGVLSLDDDLDVAFHAAGVPGTTHTDLVVLAASTDGLAEAIAGASGYADATTDPTYRTAGIGVVEGPYGLMAVQVLSG